MNYIDYILKPNCDLNRFIWICMQAFNRGVKVDEKTLAVDIKMTEVNSYYPTAIKKDKQRLHAFEKLISTQAKVKFEREYNRDQKHAQKYLNRAIKMRDKCQLLLQQAEQWQPPTILHGRLKTYVIETLQRGNDSEWEIKYYRDILRQRKPSLKKWRADKINSLLISIRNREKNMADEQKAITESIEYIVQLFQAVPIIDKASK